MNANKFIWILSDDLLNNAAGLYQQFKPKPGENLDKTQLYMENKYAVKRLSSGTYQAPKDKPCNVPSLILNSFVTALNDPINLKIPDIIVILWNDYQFWNDTVILKEQTGKILHKFFKELKKIVDIRNFALPEKAVNWDNPRIFVNKPLPLPNNMSTKYPPNYKSNRRRFVKLLQKGSVKDGYTLINFEEFTCENKNNFFKHNGSITEDGLTYIWTVISDSIQHNDKQMDVAARKAKAKQLAILNAKSPESTKRMMTEYGHYITTIAKQWKNHPPQCNAFFSKISMTRIHWTPHLQPEAAVTISTATTTKPVLLSGTRTNGSSITNPNRAEVMATTITCTQCPPKDFSHLTHSFRVITTDTTREIIPKQDFIHIDKQK